VRLSGIKSEFYDNLTPDEQQYLWAVIGMVAMIVSAIIIFILAG
jgi:hypothetical protein